MPVKIDLPLHQQTTLNFLEPPVPYNPQIPPVQTLQPGKPARLPPGFIFQSPDWKIILQSPAICSQAESLQNSNISDLEILNSPPGSWTCLPATKEPVQQGKSKRTVSPHVSGSGGSNTGSQPCPKRKNIKKVQERGVRKSYFLISPSHPPWKY